MAEFSKDKIKQFIIDGLNEVKELNGGDFEISDDLTVLGEGGALDSFEFVSFVADLEEKISDEYDKSISLVSEKAFSKKYSPFKTIDRIAEYAVELLGEAE